MAKQLNYGYTDTPISGVTQLSLPRAVVNFKADYRVREDEPDNAILTNLTVPQGKPEKFRWSYQEIADVYRNTDIEPALRTQTKRGVQILCQLTETWNVTDTEDPTYNVALPVSAHVVLKIPNSDSISAENVQYLLGRLISGLYDQGSEQTDRLAALFRGSLMPSK